MKTTVSKSDFRDAFQQMNRGDNFTYDGLGALYDLLEGTGTEQELDVIAYCCEFTEYENLEEFHADYDKDDYATIEDIENNTLVVRIDDESFIVQDF